MTARATPAKPWSLTRRLTVWYAASTFVMLTGAASVLYWGLARNLRREDARYALAKGHELREIAARFPGRLDMLRDEIGFESAMPTLQGYAARIVAADGRVDATSPGMDREVPASAFPRVDVGAPVEWTSPSGRSYLLVSTALTADGGRVAQVALDVSRDTDLLQVQGLLLAAVVLLGTLVSTVAGFAVTRRGLRPVGHITATATTVSASRLDARLGATRWPEELAELAQVFDGMLDRLQEAFGRLSRFSADIAHELRTPLTNLRGATEVALRRPRSTDAYRDVLESSLEEYERLADLIDRLLFLARADSGMAALDRQRVSLRDAMEATREYFSSAAEDGGLTVSTTGDATLDADPVLVRRALANLVANAIAHTPSGGRIRLSAETADDRVALRVADTGTGVAPEHLAHVFDRFYRAERGSTERRPGVGLGLAMVRSIAELHGGSVVIESQPGVGTTVTLRFPTPDLPNMTAP
ncbi:MAG TPA: heavy metal sensor histidine kinase [Gemmatimonadaceae bacterium]|nr:heavy metal sensor histidine kinase [Gemmatimonadaceae bacterium]